MYLRRILFISDGIHQSNIRSLVNHELQEESTRRSSISSMSIRTGGYPNQDIHSTRVFCNELEWLNSSRPAAIVVDSSFSRRMSRRRRLFRIAKFVWKHISKRWPAPYTKSPWYLSSLASQFSLQTYDNLDRASSHDFWGASRHQVTVFIILGIVMGFNRF